jgi:hypothetical protein
VCERHRPKIGDLRVTFTQEPDTCDGESIGGQDIEIEAVDSGAGHFFRIKTERWAFDDEKELVALIQRVKKMLER